MRARRLAWIAMSTVLAAYGDSRVPFQCTEDDMQWAGMSCAEDEPCPVFLELSDVQSVGNSVFLAGNLHSESTTLYSILLRSEDNGATWREPFERVRSGGLDRIQFFDFETGWVSGQVLHPLPRDPFLLLTTDGGKTWRRRAVSEEGAFGTIQQFWFDGKTQGSLILEKSRSGEGMRYELYDSPNGGESWTIRELSDKPIKLRRAPVAPNSTWRLRADSKTKAFHVEKRAGERWNSVASFPVKAGECKPEPRKEVAPPTDPVEPPRPEATGTFVVPSRRPSPRKP